MLQRLVVSMKTMSGSLCLLHVGQFNAQLPPLREFILPGGGRAAADCHMARAICRRAERRVVSLARDEEVGESAPVYLNRLSDLMFVLARVFNRQNGGDDVYWKSERLSQGSAQ